MSFSASNSAPCTTEGPIKFRLAFAGLSTRFTCRTSPTRFGAAWLASFRDAGVAPILHTGVVLSSMANRDDRIIDAMDTHLADVRVLHSRGGQGELAKRRMR